MMYFFQVYSHTVPLLCDEQLKELGVASMGDRATLRSMCRTVERCKLTELHVTTESPTTLSYLDNGTCSTTVFDKRLNLKL